MFSKYRFLYFPLSLSLSASDRVNRNDESRQTDEVEKRNTRNEKVECNRGRAVAISARFNALA